MICLVRAATEEEAFARLGEASKLFLSSAAMIDRSGIRVVAGDCESFDAEVNARLFGKEIELVVHGAAFVSGGLLEKELILFVG